MAAHRSNVWEVWDTIVNGAVNRDEDSSDEEENGRIDEVDSDSDIEVPQMSSDEEEEVVIPEANDEDVESPEIVWTETIEEINHSPFIQESGPQVRLPDNPCELDVFKELFTDTIFNKFVTETNLYARQKQASAGRQDPKWTETSVPEMSAFIGRFMLLFWNNL